MKKLLPIVLAAFLVLNFSCEGPEGPVGPAGEPGPAGQRGPAGEDAQRSSVVDIRGWDFTPDADGNYFLGILFQDYGINVTESDVVLVYRMRAFDEVNEVIYWSPLPETIIAEGGVVNYTFVNSIEELGIIIESQFDLTDFPGLTQDQVFRIVVVPGEFFPEARLNGENADLKLEYKNMLKKFNLSDEHVPLYQIK